MMLPVYPHDADWYDLLGMDRQPGDFCDICNHLLDWHVAGVCDAPGCPCPDEEAI